MNAMVVTTDSAENHEPVGDSDHVAYDKDYYWTCSCGKQGGRLTSKGKAKTAGGQHEKYCWEDGTVTVDVHK